MASTPANVASQLFGGESRVQALLFDVFGTVVDWQGSIARELSERNAQRPDTEDVDWIVFAQVWRDGFWKIIFRISNGEESPRSIDKVHREVLDRMLASTPYAALNKSWSETEREDINLVWHRLSGWPDTTAALYALKKHFILSSLANGAVRMHIDLAKHSNLPFDNVFASDILGSFKPNPDAYLKAAKFLDVQPAECCMVAAHIYDLRAAAAVGFSTIYVKRETEDVVGPDGLGDDREKVKPKSEGGEVDMVVENLGELARLVDAAKVQN